MCMTYSFLSCKFITSFSTFSFSFFQAKRVNHCEDYVNFQDIKRQLQENNLNHYLHYKSLVNRHASATHLKSFTGNFCDIVHTHRSFTFQYLR